MRRGFCLPLWCGLALACDTASERTQSVQPVHSAALPVHSAALRGHAAALPGGKRYVLKRDAEVSVDEPAVHHGIGQTTAYRYFDEINAPGVVFRKRALHPGAANGSNTLTHDEVYYVVSGKGELEVDGEKLQVTAGTAVFMAQGATNRLRQLGDEDLVLIIAYPPAAPAK